MLQLGNFVHLKLQFSYFNPLLLATFSSIVFISASTRALVNGLTASDELILLMLKPPTLCWIHNGRHYKRLNPVVQIHQEKLADFLQQFWAYYGKLSHYKVNPDSGQAERLRIEFDALFSTETGYADLDERIKKSKNKKEELLVVLKHPEVPLHNNASENGARVEKRRQDVSLQTKTQEGTRAKDTMMSIVETCKKLGISSYKFIYDRVSGINKYPTLAQMIRAKAAGQPIVI